MEKLKVGVIGVGALGKHHARVYDSLPEASLVGVADLMPGRAQEIADSVGTLAFTDYRELLGRVDAVSIATPTSLHTEIGTRFLMEGTGVLVEKPISHTIRGADDLIDEAARNGCVLQVGHLERFNPAVQEVQRIVRRPRFFEAHRMGVFSPRSLDIDVVLDLMIHDLDIISLLVDSEPAEIHAVGIPILSSRIDIANARIRFEDGCVANLTASRVSTERIRKIRLFQQPQYISMDYDLQEVAVFSLKNARNGKPAIESEKRTPPKSEPLTEEIRAFLRACRGEEPVRCTGEDGKKALSLALKILEQAQQAVAAEFDRA